MAKAAKTLTQATYNAFCAALPATTHVVQWGGADVWKVGGKVFALGRWDDDPRVSFKVSPLAYEMLKDAPGCRPAPYLASRGMTWIQAHGQGMPAADVFAYINESHRLVAAGLAKKLRRELGLDAG
jgi:predicted DNA-binding protein (MmcQ/YjbR family)